MKIAIKNPAPLGPNLAKWGDYHFGLALQSALEAEGASVVQHFWQEWQRDDGEDVVLALRGKHRYQPRHGKTHVLWVMSHPSTVGLEEIESYDLVYVASETHRTLLNGAARTPVEVMRQCTDTTRFKAPTDEDAVLARRDVIFVANSRGVRRDMLGWALEAGALPTIVGRHWGGVGLSHLVKREYVENDELPDFYAASRLSLNDHWGDMRHYGIVNNRIFDCLACGLPVLTDAFPELREVCGDAVLYAADAASYRRALSTYTLRYPDLIESTNRLWAKLRGDYSFQARAQQIVSEVAALAPRTRSERSASTPSQAEPLHELTAELMVTLRERRGARDIQLLHLYPTQAGVLHLHEQVGVNYLSGGIGPGPWHVALCKEVAQVPEERFDLILLEEVAELELLTIHERAEFLAALSRRVSASGMLAVLTGVEHRGWTDVLESLALNVASGNGKWLIATRPNHDRA